VSSTRYLLDTNICVYVVRRKPPAVLARFEKLLAGQAALSIITFGELQYGAAKSQRRDEVLRSLDELTSFLPVLALPQAAGVHYGEIRAALEAKGQPVGGNELWIASHARAAGLTLVSNNEREFRRIPGLAVENWAK
jgi:tRNA(fMet)-specific endonuclease VapC